MEQPLPIDPSLILSEASQIQRIRISAARAAEVAAEVEVLLAGLERVLPAVDFFDEPDGFRATLWSLRGPAAGGDGGG